MCQHDTYLTKLITRVCECDKNTNKKCPKDEQYEVQLLDTILFPEGGGQPYDHGTLTATRDNTKSVPVRKVLRRKLEAIHYTPTAIEVGTEVEIELDFGRRFDQAQQHSGQHLLSAVLDQLEIPTLAWSMGPDMFYVEVPRLPEDIKEVERKCNEYIRQDLPITVTETTERPKNLPEDYDASAGVIRVVSIGGIDANPCCGTHVKSTAELNSLSILHSVPIKGTNRNNFRIHCVVGSRCQRLLSSTHEQSRQAGAALSCQAADITDKIKQMQEQLRDLMKKEKLLKAEVVAIEARKMEDSLKAKGRAYLHRPTGDLDFLNSTLASMSAPIPGTCVLVAGEREGGPIIIAGQEADVKAMSERVKLAIPAVKGGGKPTRFQGKSSSYTPKDLAFLQALIEE